MDALDALPPFLAPEARVELVCVACGYGVSVRAEPPRCPMCAGTRWQEAPGAARSADGGVAERALVADLVGRAAEGARRGGDPAVAGRRATPRRGT